MSNRISEITKREITDLYLIGFVDPNTGDNVKCYWSGRCDEPDFLSRLYNLEELPSNDYRFKTASGDIYQHTVNNDDWEGDWVFDDSRFLTKASSDEEWLRFICETFHPAVRIERNNWKEMLRLINGLLNADGYELYEESHISGRAKYNWRQAGIKNAVIKQQAKELTVMFNSEYIDSQIKIMNLSIDTHPADAIGKAKELLESCCKTVLSELAEAVDENWDVIRLTKETCKVLRLTPDDIDSNAKASETIKKLLGNLAVISQSMAELRNQYGSGHGKEKSFKGLSPRHARLAVGSACTAVLFLWETYEEQKGANKL